jgi:hypothetical protein
MARAGQPQIRAAEPTATHEAPPQEMLDAFAVLRRPATAADAFETKLRIPVGGARMPQDALFNRQVWRAADGSVINTIKPPY